MLIAQVYYNVVSRSSVAPYSKDDLAAGLLHIHCFCHGEVRSLERNAEEDQVCRLLWVVCRTCGCQGSDRRVLFNWRNFERFYGVSFFVGGGGGGGGDYIRTLNRNPIYSFIFLHSKSHEINKQWNRTGSLIMVLLYRLLDKLIDSSK